MEVMKNTQEEFVTVVSVGNSTDLDNFVTVLSIGSEKTGGKNFAKNVDESDANAVIDAHPEEEVDVYRLPGERLGFGLKFEGGNKTTEKVRKLFVQSCASESPASRAVCSWGTLGEGDEVISIDGVPVTQMTRLDCVRRLKESQLVIKLLVRYRGALRPEVVSAERKCSPEKRKTPPELPTAPPPVPPRKLRQPRGPADGDANPSPVRKPWSSSQTPTSSPGDSPRGQNSSGKSTSYESCESSPVNKNSSKTSSPKVTPKLTHSPDPNKTKQEIPEAAVYSDARAHDNCSTHGSTSDDTGSSMSTVIDRFSTTSDRFSTASEQPHHPETKNPIVREQPRSVEAVATADSLDLVRLLAPFDQLEREFGSNPPTTDYLLARLANSEAVTFVESLGGDGDGVVERVTAVVAPNTVLIEETITLQPPLSFQDAPLSYGHETRPGLVYEDLAADSTTHFRPIKDDALVVDCVNGNVDPVIVDRPSKSTNEEEVSMAMPARREGPPLPARNHVNRINVNRDATNDLIEQDSATNREARHLVDAPALPPKPMPRKEVKARRKRPPPPPPPRREASSLPIGSKIDGPPVIVGKESEKSIPSTGMKDDLGNEELESVKNAVILSTLVDVMRKETSPRQIFEDAKEDLSSSSDRETYGQEEEDEDPDGTGTNKMLEIIEMRKMKALRDKSTISESILAIEDVKNASKSTILENGDKDIVRKDSKEGRTKVNETLETEGTVKSDSKRSSTTAVATISEISKDEGCRINQDNLDDDDSTDDSDGDGYYWQSNLATIGEEEETNSLEFTSVNRQSCDVEKFKEDDGKLLQTESLTLLVEENSCGKNDRDEVDCLRRGASSGEETRSEHPVPAKNAVNGRMENCGGGQRLPPDGDEFPMTYQEFNTTQRYQFVASSRVTSSTLGTELNNPKSSPSLGSNGIHVSGESQVFASSEPFKLRPADTEKLQSIDSARSGPTSTTIAGSATSPSSVREEKTIFLPDNRIVSIKSCVVSESVVEIGKPKTELVSETLTVDGHQPRLTNGNGTTEKTVISEKRIRISGYYENEDDEEADRDRESAKVTAKECTGDGLPPPLPTTRPPKSVENHASARNPQQKIRPPTPQRKFSLTGELWRQDDKSEKSVRDKIAMFSSRSSLDVPLFPSLATASPVVDVAKSNNRRLSKYKSSEDFFAEDAEELRRKEQIGFTERTRSSFDLSSTGSGVGNDRSGESFRQPPSLPLVSPPESPKTSRKSFDYPRTSVTTPRSVGEENARNAGRPSLKHSSSFSYDSPALSKSIVASSSPVKNNNSSQKTAPNMYEPLIISSMTLNGHNQLGATLNRATSFSGGLPNLHSRSQSMSDLPPSPQVSRTNSLASTFRRPSDDARRTSLNQLIEQRRKGISKLRGLVIPEKEAIPVSQPIIDLPEIKSRDSIVLQQLPRANIQDKWGSQSSISSAVSTVSVPSRTTSFKIPAAPNLPKYSPAFKRKSLAVCGTATPTKTNNEPPKSLESICSPTRSDCSFFEYSTSSASSRAKPPQRKTRSEYDDSDNDSAVSSSQSSISRGFSPPVSPVPSERSTISSERSYLSTETAYARSSGLESPSRNFAVNESRAIARERAQFPPRPSYHQASEVSSSSSSSSNSSSPDPRSSQPEIYARSQQHRSLNRSSSTDTNCSSASSTLTSGSQASAESLSRRVLKPQSVEAINRKNILASARCRSGRDLNGSPLIQRKFKDDEDPSKLASEHESYPIRRTSIGSNDCASNVDKSTTKVAYIEIEEGFITANEDPPTSELPPRTAEVRGRVRPEVRAVRAEVAQPSNDMKKWVRAEVRAMSGATTVGRGPETPRVEETKIESDTSSRSARISREKKSSVSVPSDERKRIVATVEENASSSNDLLTVLTTRTRSRSAIHVEDRSFGRSQSRASLEEILDGKPGTAESDSDTSNFAKPFLAGSSSKREEKVVFASKIPTPDRPRPVAEREAERNESATTTITTTSRIPMPRSLGRRSVSVTDMKKALEKSDNLARNSGVQNSRRSVSGAVSHDRFPSLDSSVDESIRRRGDADADKCTTSEQFGSISSLASTTSLISQQELAQLVEEATLDEHRGLHEVIVVLLHKENPAGSVGIALAGGADCEAKEITVHRVLSHSIADKDGRVQRGDRILSINGRSTRGLTHRESLAVLKQPRSEVVLVVSRTRDEAVGSRLRSRTASVETIVEGSEVGNATNEETAWGPPSALAIIKDGAGLGFSLEGGRDSPLGDRPLIVKKIFAGGAAEKTGALKAGDQMLEVNGSDVTRMSRIEAWSLMKKLQDGEVNLLVRHPATKSS